MILKDGYQATAFDPSSKWPQFFQLLTGMKLQAPWGLVLVPTTVGLPCALLVTGAAYCRSSLNACAFTGGREQVLRFRPSIHPVWIVLQNLPLRSTWN